ncbi:MAG: hypothetical protein QME58_04080 [Bacteroidota bacterium]|nr:hypothetical protein [Bacteroidota bacterium]
MAGAEVGAHAHVHLPVAPCEDEKDKRVKRQLEISAVKAEQGWEKGEGSLETLHKPGSFCC